MTAGSVHIRERVKALEVKTETLWEPLKKDVEKLSDQLAELTETVTFYAKMAVMLGMAVAVHGGSEYAKAAGDFFGLLLGVHG